MILSTAVLFLGAVPYLLVGSSEGRSGSRAKNWLLASGMVALSYSSFFLSLCALVSWRSQVNPSFAPNGGPESLETFRHASGSGALLLLAFGVS